MILSKIYRSFCLKNCKTVANSEETLPITVQVAQNETTIVLEKAEGQQIADWKGEISRKTTKETKKNKKNRNYKIGSKNLKKKQFN